MCRGPARLSKALLHPFSGSTLYHKASFASDPSHPLNSFTKKLPITCLQRSCACRAPIHSAVKTKRCTLQDVRCQKFSHPILCIDLRSWRKAWSSLLKTLCISDIVNPFVTSGLLSGWIILRIDTTFFALWLPNLFLWRSVPQDLGCLQSSKGDSVPSHFAW